MKRRTMWWMLAAKIVENEVGGEDGGEWCGGEDGEERCINERRRD